MSGNDDGIAGPAGVNDLEDVFLQDGPLARALPGYLPREQQVRMATTVAETLEAGEVLIAEAGTGTGKTFAYLVPALQSGLKVIVSTGTRNLQDQLYLKDIPKLRDALVFPGKVALLKGRANYLCRHRLENALVDPRGQTREVAAQMVKVREWSDRTKRGDRAELVDFAEDAAIWPLVTSTAENCLGSECPSFNNCHLVEARRQAQEADLVVVNHHLLCADFALRGDGFGELLPSADAFIIDEAHQLPEVASSFFGISVGTRQLLDLVRDTQAEYYREAGDMPELLKSAEQLGKLARDLRLAFGDDGKRGAWRELEGDASVINGLKALRRSLDLLDEQLSPATERGKGLASCRERVQKLRADLSVIVEPGAERDDVRWYEVHRHTVRLNATPLDVATVFSAAMSLRTAAWVFTSATLAVGRNFDHFKRQLGLDTARTEIWGSPFDYSKQALWFVPRGLPQPSEYGYTEAVMELALPIVEASRGRAFLLFTSHRALRIAGDWLEGRTEHLLLVQGTAPKTELLKRFVEDGNAVLLGTSSFWEGVDVQGEALSLVVIDKLPFASPGDPVLQARLDALKRSGENPFMAFQVPQAAIALKQGAGRLIRGVNDRGVLVVCDPRLLKRGYGQTFLDSMPDFARTREPGEVVEFLQRTPGAASPHP